jgi:hypothetical protein
MPRNPCLAASRRGTFFIDGFHKSIIVMHPVPDFHKEIACAPVTKVRLVRHQLQVARGVPYVYTNVSSVSLQTLNPIVTLSADETAL